MCRNKLCQEILQGCQIVNNSELFPSTMWDLKNISLGLLFKNTVNGGHPLIALDGHSGPAGWGLWWKAKGSDTVTHCGV